MQWTAKRLVKFLLAITLFICFFAALTIQFNRPEGAMADDKAPALKSQPPWIIYADRIDYDQNHDKYIATGAVNITKGERILTADTVKLNQKTGDATADGNVRLVSNTEVLAGSHLETNLHNETGLLSNGNVFISKSHLYLSGPQIRKTGPLTYSATDIKITACDGPDPDWELTGKDFKMTIEGYGTAKHAAFWAGGIPLLYSPYLLFPVKLKRQTGFLIPGLNFSDRKGFEYQQPFFWAINDNSDATFYSHFMSKRGFRNGIEYRYILNQNTKGAIFAESLKDSQIDDGQANNSHDYGFDGDQVLRENSDRYWFRMKHDQGLGWGLTTKLDIDILSDQDYLHEFQSGYNGFKDTQAYFDKTFGRSLDDYNDPIRTNRLNINRIWPLYSFNTDLRWYDNVINRRLGNSDSTLQQLPTIYFDGLKQPIGNSYLYFDLATSYTHFYRINGIRGHRTDIYPRLYYPFDFFEALSVEPSIGGRQTTWQVDPETTPADDDTRNTQNRSLYDIKLDISTEFFRIFDFNVGGSDRLKHTITPEIIYEYIPEKDQSEFPSFDELDRIERKNQIFYGITNTFTARASGVSSKDETNIGGYRYTPFLRFKLGQTFDINRYNEDEVEPFGNITAELDLTPGRYVSLDSDAQWSIYDNELDVFNAALTLWDLRGDRLTADYRYTRDLSDTVKDGIQTIHLEGELQATSKWKLIGELEHNYYNDLEIDRMVGVKYHAGCWGLIMAYTIQEGNESYRALIDLAGLGNLD